MKKNHLMEKYSFLGSLHISFYDKLYSQYLEDPDSVDTSWRSFFQGYEFANEPYNILEKDLPIAISKEFQVISLIDDFRKRGHLFLMLTQKLKTYLQIILTLANAL